MNPSLTAALHFTWLPCLLPHSTETLLGSSFPKEPFQCNANTSTGWRFPFGPHGPPLTQGTEPQRVPLRWGGWPALLPPPWAAWWPACGASPGGTSRVSAPCTCVGGWWCAARCGGSPAWRHRGHPPWNSPGSCKTRADSETRHTTPAPSVTSHIRTGDVCKQSPCSRGTMRKSLSPTWSTKSCWVRYWLNWQLLPNSSSHKVLCHRAAGGKIPADTNKHGHVYLLPSANITTLYLQAAIFKVGTL